MVIASLRYSLPAGGAVVEPTKWINWGPSKAEIVQLCEQTKWSSLPHCQIASKHIGDEKSIIHLLTLVNNTPFYYSSLQLFPQKSLPPLRPVIYRQKKFSKGSVIIKTYSLTHESREMRHSYNGRWEDSITKKGAATHFSWGFRI